MHRPVSLAQLLLAFAASLAASIVMFLIVVLNQNDEPQFAFDDVREYCSAVHTLDEPDIRWMGAPTPAEVHNAAVAAFTDEIVRPNPVLWRCMDGEVWWCLQWGTNWCPKRDLSSEASPRMYGICAKATEDRPLSRAEYGWATVWSWWCKSGRPVPDLTHDESSGLDSRYFTAALWRSLEDGQHPESID